MASDTARHYPGKDLEAMAFAVNYHQWIVDEFAPYLGDVVAEVGAGAGSVSRLLLQRRIARLVAFEPSDEMYPRLVHELAGDARAEAVHDFFTARSAPGAFDSIVYLNVLEHIDNDRVELGNAHAALKPQGHLLLFVPALAWLYSALDREIGHRRRYAKLALERLVRDCGFTIVSARYFDFAGILPWYVKFVVLRQSIGRGGVSLYDKLVVPPVRRIEAAIPPPIGKNVLLIARKA
jgi:SAM-dependent methyltransferase